MKQLNIFEEYEKKTKPWWMGIVCKKMHYFDLLSQGVDIEDISKEWLIEDYQNKKI